MPAVCRGYTTANTRPGRQGRSRERRLVDWTVLPFRDNNHAAVDAVSAEEMSLLADFAAAHIPFAIALCAYSGCHWSLSTLNFDLYIHLTLFRCPDVRVCPRQLKRWNNQASFMGLNGSNLKITLCDFKSGTAWRSEPRIRSNCTRRRISPSANGTCPLPAVLSSVQN